MLITYFQNLLAQFIRNEKGQTAVEYGLVVALIALVVVVALAAGVSGVIGEIVTKLEAAL